MGEKWDDRVWYKQFRCPKCGYTTNVTNVCRACPKMPATERTRIYIYCFNHYTIHRDSEGHPTTHKSVMMVETGWASRFNPILKRSERRKIKNLPEGAILR